MGWDVGGVNCVPDAILGDACTHGMERGHIGGLEHLVVSVG
jgi:hypothetical protein